MLSLHICGSLCSKIAFPLSHSARLANKYSNRVSSWSPGYSTAGNYIAHRSKFRIQTESTKSTNPHQTDLDDRSPLQPVLCTARFFHRSHNHPAVLFQRHRKPSAPRSKCPAAPYRSSSVSMSKQRFLSPRLSCWRPLNVSCSHSP